MQNIPQANELQFEKIEGNLPIQNCNCCGKLVEGDNVQIASVKISDDADVSFIVCNDFCKTNFVNHQGVNDYIIDLFNRVEKMRQ